MAIVALPNTLSNDTDADADQVMANFNALLAALNGGIDATNLAASLLQGVPKPGDGRFTFTAAEPAGWLICDGRAVSRATYSALFNAIGTTWGPGDGATTFNLPDLRGRVAVGAGTGTGGGASGAAGTKPAGGAALTARALGSWAGEETHVLTIAELAAHNHPSTADLPNFIYVEGGGGADNFELAAGSDTTDVRKAANTSGNAGSNTAHNNVQPFVVVNVLVKT